MNFFILISIVLYSSIFVFCAQDAKSESLVNHLRELENSLSELLKEYDLESGLTDLVVQPCKYNDAYLRVHELGGVPMQTIKNWPVHEHMVCYYSETLKQVTLTLLAKTSPGMTNPQTGYDTSLRTAIDLIMDTCDVFIHGGAIRDLVAGKNVNQVADVDLFFSNGNLAEETAIWNEWPYMRADRGFDYIKFGTDGEHIEALEGAQWDGQFLGSHCAHENSVNGLSLDVLNFQVWDATNGEGVRDILAGRVSASCDDVDEWLKNKALMRAFKMPLKGFAFTPAYATFIARCINRVIETDGEVEFVKDCEKAMRKFDKGGDIMHGHFVDFMDHDTLTSDSKTAMGKCRKKSDQ